MHAFLRPPSFEAISGAQNPAQLGHPHETRPAYYEMLHMLATLLLIFPAPSLTYQESV